jgi:hypothetical protein
MVEGAVPYLGDLLIQVALLVDVQLRVAPPVLLMEKDPYEGQQKPRTMVRPSHQAGCASSITVWLRAIVEAASVRLSDTVRGLVGVSEEQAATMMVHATANAV